MTDSTEDIRWVICEETQQCLWDSPESIPEVDIAGATVIDTYGTEEQAMDALKAYLSRLGATFTWADVLPIETCAICRKDFNTVDWHIAIVLSEEAGTEENPEILDATYPARFCTNCVPCKPRDDSTGAAKVH